MLVSVFYQYVFSVVLLCISLCQCYFSLLLSWLAAGFPCTWTNKGTEEQLWTISLQVCTV